MLEDLFVQLELVVPPVPLSKVQREPLQARNGGAVPLVPPVPSENVKVICFTPNGNPIEVTARNVEQAGLLRRWNPEPTAAH
jgi:hypothetical protein